MKGEGAMRSMKEQRVDKDNTGRVIGRVAYNGRIFGPEAAGTVCRFCFAQRDVPA